MFLNSGTLKLPRRTFPQACLRRRLLSTSSSLRSGHSRWSTIKHDKGKNDAVKAKQRTALSKEIADASKMFGPELSSNTRLGEAIAKAKRGGFSKGGIESAVARGQGKSTSGAPLEALTVEAVLPPVAMIIDAQTDNKARALSEMRNLLKSAGAQATPTSYLFEKRGRIMVVPHEGVSFDDVLDVALGPATEAGALDIEEDDQGRIIVDTEPSALKAVEAALQEIETFNLSGSETIWVPNEDTRVETIDLDSLTRLVKLQEDIEDYPGVQAIYINADTSQLQAQQEQFASAAAQSHVSS